MTRIISGFLFTSVQLEKKNGHTQPDVNGQEGEGVSRRLSKRQQEKAPENQAQHAGQDGEAPSTSGPPEKVESKFREAL